MLSIQAQKQLLQVIGLPADEIEQLLAAEDPLDITLPDGIRVYDAEGYAALEAQLKANGKTGYINAGKEIAIKNLKEKLGIEYDGKDADVFLQKAREKILADAGDAEQLATLRQQLQDYEAQLQTLSTEKQSLTRDTEWLKKFPAGRSTGMSDEDRLLLLKTRLTQQQDDGGNTTYLYKGKPLADEEGSYDIARTLQHVFTEERWLGDSYSMQHRPGRGTHSSRGSGYHPMTLTEAETQWERTGRKAEGYEFQAHVVSLKKENPDFDLNK